MDTTRIDGLRVQLLEGLPARVQGMAEALILEWAEAVDAVPQLAAVASREIIDLLGLTPEQREVALRRRWRRGSDDVHLVGSPQRPVLGTALAQTSV